MVSQPIPSELTNSVHEPKKPRATLRDRRGHRGERRVGLLLSLPYVTFNAIFWAVPFFWVFIIAFQQYNLLSPIRPFVGLANFQAVFSSNALRYVSTATAEFFLVFVPVTLTTAILLALAVRRVRYLKALFLALFLLPSVSPQVGYSLVFKYMFAGDGVINHVTHAIGLPPVPWFTDPTIAMGSIAVVVAWRMAGYFALFFLASMQSISPSLYEAAQLDGASRWKIFWRVTWPMLNAALIVTLVLSVVTGFSLFAEPYLITNGGPLNATTSFIMILYQRAFNFLQLGFGAAWAIVTAAISLAIVTGLRRLLAQE